MKKLFKKTNHLFLYSVICFVFCFNGQAQTKNDTLIFKKIYQEFLKFEQEIKKDSMILYVRVDYNTLISNTHNALDYKKDTIYYYKEPNLKNFMKYIRKKYCR